MRRPPPPLRRRSPRRVRGNDSSQRHHGNDGNDGNDGNRHRHRHRDHIRLESVAQLASVESILDLAGVGRQALAGGNLTAAIANRRQVLQQLNGLQPDAQLAPSVAALKAAETFPCTPTQPAG